jgi:hypothetical protein
VLKLGILETHFDLRYSLYFSFTRSTARAHPCDGLNNSFPGHFNRSLGRCGSRERNWLHIATHSLANDFFQSCSSPDDVLRLLEEKTQSFKPFCNGIRKSISWLSPVVHVVYNYLLGTSITLVSRETLVLFISIFSPILLPGSILTGRGDLCWRERP